MVVTNDQCAQTSVYICLELLFLESLKTIAGFIVRMHREGPCPPCQDGAIR